MTSKKVLILTGSYGDGHNAAANSLKEYYQKIGYETKTIDIIDHINNLLAKSTKKLYKVSSSEYPKIWEKIFNTTDSPVLARMFYGIKDPIGQPKFNKIIDEYQPEQVISVFHFWNWWIKNYIKYKGHNFKWGILITDAINIQSFWYVKAKYIDCYFVFDDKTKEDFIEKFNFDKEKVKVSFFPFLKDKFINKEKIENNKILILLTGLEKENIDYILDNLKGYDITILKGRNDDLYNELKKKYKNNYNFLDFLNILDNLKYYNLMIGKPGGALTCECIATDTPLIVPSYFPGQEEGNKELLEYTETGIYEKDPQKIVFMIKYMNWSKFLPNFKKIKKENSCEIIYRALKK